MSPEPLVKKKPRSRNKDGTWRKKRSDASKLKIYDPETETTYSIRMRSAVKEKKGTLMGTWNPVDALKNEIEALKRQVDILTKDNGELRIKIKAYEREAEIKDA